MPHTMLAIRAREQHFLVCCAARSLLWAGSPDSCPRAVACPLMLGRNTPSVANRHRAAAGSPIQTFAEDAGDGHAADVDDRPGRTVNGTRNQSLG
jgi:hypothetical protein